MKANELMIGDWVRCTDPKPFRIEQIDGVEEQCYGDDGFWVDTRDLRPIPLTGEILEKNGFVFESKYYGGFIQKSWTKHFSIANFIVLYEREDCFRTLVLYLNTSIHYVHELQHALRLCGIEKEIEL